MLVTGGSSGIGRAIALRFAAEGAAVAVLDLREDPLEGGTPTHEDILREGGKAIYASADVRDSEAVEAAFAAAEDQFGDLDTLICAAGALEPSGASLDVAPRDFADHLARNVTGTFICDQAALRRFVRHGRGKIVNIASNFGLVGVGELAAYCAGKAAVIGLTKSLAVEFGGRGININALCPGATATALNAEARRDEGTQRVWRHETPLRMGGEAAGYVADPADIAHAALFLASPQSRFQTGSTLVVDGGWTAH